MKKRIGTKSLAITDSAEDARLARSIRALVKWHECRNVSALFRLLIAAAAEKMRAEKRAKRAKKVGKA